MSSLVQIPPYNEATKVYLVSESTLSQYLPLDLAKILKFTGRYGQVIVLAEKNEVYVGVTLTRKIKSVDVFSTVNTYQLGAKVVRALQSTEVSSLRVMNFAREMQNISQDISRYLLNFMLGMHQAAWMLDSYISKDRSLRKELNISVSIEDQVYITDNWQKELEALHAGITLTRRVVDDIPEEIHPESMSELIQKEFASHKNAVVKILQQYQLEQMGMGALLAVGRASRYNPVLTHVILKPKGVVKHRLALVGKGLTYDSGGLDVKVGGYMRTMKMDMGGSGLMLGVMKALSMMNLEHTEVHWMTGFVENMIDGSSYKSDDILTTMSGQTIEVLNTDAEGRLTLADVLTYATLQDPDYIIDAATLTGACVRAISEYATGLMGNDQELIDMLMEVFIEEQENTVHIPMSEVLRNEVEGEISDLRNIGKEPNAGHITAGLFLSYFVDQNCFRNESLGIKSPKAYPWVHLDIAGSAYNKQKNDLEANGATGQSVRSLVRFIQKLDQR